MKPFLHKPIIVFLFLLCSGLQSQTVQPLPQQAQAPTKFPEAAQFQKSKLSYKIINSPGVGFGYDIFADGKLLIHQPSIPAVAGNNGFKTKESAEKVAKLVINKVAKGEMPPTVTVEEMKKLKAIK